MKKKSKISVLLLTLATGSTSRTTLVSSLLSNLSGNATPSNVNTMLASYPENIFNL